MNEAPSTQDTPPTNPPQSTEQQTQQQPHAQPSQQPPANAGPGPGTQILAELQALPERITNAIKEAMVPPRAPANPQPPQNPASNAQSATAANSQQSSNSQPNKSGTETTKEPGRKTFAEWWFKG